MIRMQIKKSPGHDALAADIVRKGRFGVAHIRAVAPLGPIRNALQAQLASQGIARTAMSGDPVFAQRCERKVEQLAGIGLLHTIAEAAAAPRAAQNKARARVAKKCAQLIQMCNDGTLAGIGGWPAVAQAVQRKHAACVRAWKAQGMSDDAIKKCLARMAAEDSAAIQQAVTATEGEMSGFSLTNLARKAVNLSQKFSPSHYLMRKVAPGMEKFSPSHYLSNKFTRGGRGGPAVMPPGTYMPGTAMPAGANFGPQPGQGQQPAAPGEQPPADAGPPIMDPSSPMDYELEAQDATQPPSDEPRASYDDNQPMDDDFPQGE